MTGGSKRAKRAVTLRMVAAHAGVSPMSVSNVINGHRVSEETREKVTQSIAHLGYVPNPAARQLASAAPAFIGLVHVNDEHPLSAALLNGALSAASRLGVQLLLQPITFPDIDRGWEAVRILRNRGAEAILLPPVFGEKMATLNEAALVDFPVICVGPADAIPGIPTVRIDDRAAAYDLTALLIAKGHRRIGLLQVPEHFTIHHTRGGGYRDALATHGLPFDPELVERAEYTFQEGLAASARLLDHSDPPTAIIGSNDELAAATLTTAHARGIPVPERLAIAGFGDSYFARTIWPPLTSVRIPTSEMAQAALQALVQMVANGSDVGETSPELSKVFDFCIMQRASTE